MAEPIESDSAGVDSPSEEKEFDLSAAIDNIAEDMDLEVPGREDDAEKTTEGAPAGKEGPAPAAAPGDAKGAAGTAAVAAPVAGSSPPPETWSAEGKARWAEIPPEVQAEVLKREDDVMRGFAEYAPRVKVGDAFAQIVAPFAETYNRNGIAAVQLVPALLQTHAMLTWGSPEQKVAIFRQLAQDIGLDVTKLTGEQPAQAVNPMLPQVQALQQQIAAVMNNQQGVANALYQTRVNEAEQQISAFMADPKNVHFSDLVDDIRQLFERGQAKTLPEAYEKAVYLNPVTRAREIDRVALAKADKAAKERADHAVKARKAASANVRSSEQSGTAPRALGTLDDTLHQTLADIRARE